MSTWLYNLNPLPLWIYTKASSAYTALIQFYAHSGQLVTVEGMCQKNTLTCPKCRFGCPHTENPHHIFVICDRYLELRSKELDTLITGVKRRLDDAKLNSLNQSHIMHTVKHIFSDSKDVWPLQSSMYYLGQIPKIEPLIQPLSMTNAINHSMLIHNITADMHLASTCLASRIYGDVQREMTRRHNELCGAK
jgi:hypothetical protein